MASRFKNIKGVLHRKFSGRWFRLYGSYASKRDAQTRAFNLRIGGGKARVVEESKGEWVVYTIRPGR